MPSASHYFSTSISFSNIYKLEKTVDKSIYQGLKDLYYNVEYIDGTHGGGQAIKIDRAKGNLIGGSDLKRWICSRLLTK